MQISKYIVVIFSLLFYCVNAQNNDAAKICFYKADKILCNSFNYDIEINKQNVYTIKPTISKKVALEYQVLSEGIIHITIKNWGNDWSASTNINVKNGKTYYVKIDCSISGVYLTTNDSSSSAEWALASRDFVVKMAEDPNNPLIKKEEIENSSNAKSKIVEVYKFDTIKQIVYVKEDKTFKFEAFTDIDKNIPLSNKVNEQTYALIIGNEDYKNYQPDLNTEVNVMFAKRDAFLFKEYVIKSLGVPEKNVNFLLDATYGQISQAISKLNLIAKTTGGNAKILFYYAGHGMPDEQTKEPYIIPVDISGAFVSNGIKLKDVYFKLTEFPVQNVLVFLDACFTGGARNESLIAGRSISIKPKEQLLKGNIVVFSASSGNQSSLSYTEKKHGMFTYFLLKKINESGTSITLKELNEYIKEKVALESLLINSKEQNPQTNTSTSIIDKWGKWKLND
ncbi:MAG: caspase family protein [Bacteroidetes bacterium]|nr:caspase family protein [Bacteroidota bacterium]